MHTNRILGKRREVARTRKRLTMTRLPKGPSCKYRGLSCLTQEDRISLYIQKKMYEIWLLIPPYFDSFQGVYIE